MTEEIIIDGVNVAGCKHITKAREVGDQHCALYDYNYCIGKMCEYKQLKRLKQQHNDDTEEIAKLGLDVAILEQENKEMKSALEEIRKDIKCFYSFEDSSNDYQLENIIDKINEVLNG